MIANTFQYAHVTGFGGFGVSEATWSVAMMAVATALGVSMAWTKGALVFPVVVAWALHGIGVRYAESALPSGAARVLVAVGLVGGIAASVRMVRRRSPRWRKPQGSASFPG